MPIERRVDRGTRRGLRALHELGEEFRHARLMAGLAQQSVADAVHISRSVYSRVECGKQRNLTIVLAGQIAAVLGLDLAAKAYVGGSATRDGAHARLILRFVANVGRPVHYRTEVTLPRANGYPEQRSWDIMLIDANGRTAVEFEMRLYDIQAQLRRHRLKRRDDPVDSFLLVIADTPANRRVLGEFC